MRSQVILSNWNVMSVMPLQIKLQDKECTIAVNTKQSTSWRENNFCRQVHSSSPMTNSKTSTFSLSCFKCGVYIACIYNVSWYVGTVLEVSLEYNKCIWSSWQGNGSVLFLSKDMEHILMHHWQKNLITLVTSYYESWNIEYLHIKNVEFS